LAIYDADFPRLTFRNSTSGDTTSDGMEMYMAGANFYHDLGEAGSQIFYTSGTERVRIDSSGNVGVGTSSPLAKMNISGTDSDFIGLLLDNFNTTDAGTETTEIKFRHYRSYNPSVTDAGKIVVGKETAWNGTNNRLSYMSFYTRNGSTEPEERMRILSSGGITFNGDTAAANALDDYEEGTWTPATSTSGYTISSSSGIYTKIGRQVTVKGKVKFSAVNAASNSQVFLTGLPLTPSVNFAGVARETSNTGAIYMVEARTVPDIQLNSMDGVSSGSQRTIRTNEDYEITVTYFV
jgi:hypothetical protein